MATTRALTDTAVRNLKPDPAGKTIERADHSSPGLRLRVSPAGRKVWFYRYRDKATDKLQKITLGTYPTLSLADARTRWAELSRSSNPRATVTAEKDRQRELDQQIIEQAAGVTTVRDLVRRYARHISNPARASYIKSWKPATKAIERTVVQRHGDKPIRELTRSDVRDVLDRLRDQGKAVMANRVLAYTRKCFNWAIEAELLDTNPCALLKVTPEKARQVSLNSTELKKLLHNLPKTSLTTQEQDLLVFILATGCRISEACDMPRAELFLDEREWRIDESRTKNGKQHTVYLSDLAAEILERQPKDTAMVWANPRSATGALRRDTLEAHLRDAHDKLPTFTPHDLRRTMATWLGESEVDDRVIDRMLNHQPRTLSRVYNTSKYNAPARQWWQAWGKHLQGLKAGNVVQLKGRRRRR